MITETEVYVASGLVAALAAFLLGREFPRDDLREVAHVSADELNRAYEKGLDDGWDDHVAWLDETSAAAAVSGVPAADLDRPDLGQGAGATWPGNPPGDEWRSAGLPTQADDLATDAPVVRADRGLGDQPAVPWEPEATDLIRLQAGHHYDPPGPGMVPGEMPGQAPIWLHETPGPGDQPEVIDLLGDTAAFAMIHADLARIRDELAAMHDDDWRPVLPAWDRRAA